MSSESPNPVLTTGTPQTSHSDAAVIPQPPPPPSRKASTSPLIPGPPLASSRYNRQLMIPSIGLRGQALLSRTRILIIGLGGLGCPAALYLAGAGVHTLGLVDGDTVELSNLHRQILHRESSVGWSKIDSAVRGLTEVNSEVNYVPHPDRLSPQNALDVVKGYDIILDCTDNPATRYLISDVCVLLGKPLVSGAAQRTEGQSMVLNYPVGKGPCYRCIFPKPPAPETVLGCSEIGILGPVVGAIGVLMASEASKLITASEEERDEFKPTLLLYNAFSKDPRSRFRAVGLRSKRKECVACGTEVNAKTKITESSLREGGMDYEAFCGRVEDVRVLAESERVGARHFLAMMNDRRGDLERNGDKQSIVVDVREENEYELGAKVRGGVNIPISRILRRGWGQAREETSDIFDQIVDTGMGGNGERNVYFVCQRGNDSQIAARKMIDTRAAGGSSDGGGKLWIGDVEGGFVAIQREVNGLETGSQ